MKNTLWNLIFRHLFRWRLYPFYWTKASPRPAQTMPTLALFEENERCDWGNPCSIHAQNNQSQHIIHFVPAITIQEKD